MFEMLFSHVKLVLVNIRNIYKNHKSSIRILKLPDCLDIS